MYTEIRDPACFGNLISFLESQCSVLVTGLLHVCRYSCVNP